MRQDFGTFIRKYLRAVIGILYSGIWIMVLIFLAYVTARFLMLAHDWMNQNVF